LAADFLAGRFLLVALRERELAVFFTPEREEELVLLRDPGGEDVRVAMTPNLGDRHSSPTDHTAVCRREPGGPPAGSDRDEKSSRAPLDRGHSCT